MFQDGFGLIVFLKTSGQNSLCQNKSEFLRKLCCKRCTTRILANKFFRNWL